MKKSEASLMHFDEEIPQEVSEFNKTLIENLANMPSFLGLTPQEIRAREKINATEKSSIAVDRYITGFDGNSIKLRQFLPPKINSIYLFFHGGGWISGAADWQDMRLEKMAVQGNMAVISVEYRLAPENPFPASVDDCEAVALWLIHHAKKEYGTEQILIGGGSAGAHLCALTLLRMRDKHHYVHFRAANLVFGMYDLSMTPSMRNWGDRELVLSTPIVNKLLDYFLAQDIDRKHSEVSPLYANLQKMPPAIFTVGTADPLLDDTLFMCMRWLSAGNKAKLLVCPGGVHGFITFPTKQAEDARNSILDFLLSYCK